MGGPEGARFTLFVFPYFFIGYFFKILPIIRDIIDGEYLLLDDKSFIIVLGC